MVSQTMASGRIEQGFDAATRSAAFLRRAPYACVRATGADALDLLHRLSTNDLRRLRSGQVARTILTNEKGRMIDLITVAALEDGLLFLVSRGNEHHVQRWIEKYTIAEEISRKPEQGDEPRLHCRSPVPGGCGRPRRACRARGRYRRRAGRTPPVDRRDGERPMGMGSVSGERRRDR